MPHLLTLNHSAACVVSHSNGCPLCHGRLVRTWRRQVDRFTSLFVPVQRFKCDAFSCQWEGNLRLIGHSDRAAAGLNGSDGAKAGSEILILQVLIIALATLVIVAISMSDSWMGQVKL